MATCQSVGKHSDLGAQKLNRIGLYCKNVILMEKLWNLGAMAPGSYGYGYVCTGFVYWWTIVVASEINNNYCDLLVIVSNGTTIDVGQNLYCNAYWREFSLK